MFRNKQKRESEHYLLCSFFANFNSKSNDANNYYGEALKRNEQNG